jgi:hypothetical protein
MSVLPSFRRQAVLISGAVLALVLGALLTLGRPSDVTPGASTAPPSSRTAMLLPQRDAEAGEAHSLPDATASRLARLGPRSKAGTGPSRVRLAPARPVLRLQRGKLRVPPPTAEQRDRFVAECMALPPVDVELPALTITYADEQEHQAIARWFGEREAVVVGQDPDPIAEVTSYEPLAVSAWLGPPPGQMFGQRVKRRTAAPYYRAKLKEILARLQRPVVDADLIGLIPEWEDRHLGALVLHALKGAGLEVAEVERVRGTYRRRAGGGFEFVALELTLSAGRTVRLHQ